MAATVAGALTNLFSKAKASAFSYVQQMIDDQITKKLAPYLATALGEDGREVSDVVVDEKGDISIMDCVLRPSAVDELLAENELPFHVVSAMAKRIHIDIPWGDLSAGEWTFEVEGLSVLLVPKERADWSIEDVRRVKEALILRDLTKLLKAMDQLNAKPKRRSPVPT